MHITMNNVELKEAVELWLENEGLTPDRYNIEVKFVAGRNGNEGRIEVNAQKKVSAILEDKPEITEVEEKEDIKEDPFNNEPEVKEVENRPTVKNLFNTQGV